MMGLFDFTKGVFDRLYGEPQMWRSHSCAWCGAEDMLADVIISPYVCGYCRTAQEFLSHVDGVIQWQRTVLSLKLRERDARELGS